MDFGNIVVLHGLPIVENDSGYAELLSYIYGNAQQRLHYDVTLYMPKDEEGSTFSIAFLTYESPSEAESAIWDLQDWELLWGLDYYDISVLPFNSTQHHLHLNFEVETGTQAFFTAILQYQIQATEKLELIEERAWLAEQDSKSAKEQFSSAVLKVDTANRRASTADKARAEAEDARKKALSKLAAAVKAREGESKKRSEAEAEIVIVKGQLAEANERVAAADRARAEAGETCEQAVSRAAAAEEAKEDAFRKMSDAESKAVTMEHQMDQANRRAAASDKARFEAECKTQLAETAISTAIQSSIDRGVCSEVALREANAKAASAERRVDQMRVALDAAEAKTAETESKVDELIAALEDAKLESLEAAREASERVRDMEQALGEEMALRVKAETKMTLLQNELEEVQKAKQFTVDVNPSETDTIVTAAIHAQQASEERAIQIEVELQDAVERLNEDVIQARAKVEESLQARKAAEARALHLERELHVALERAHNLEALVDAHHKGADSSVKVPVGVEDSVVQAGLDSRNVVEPVHRHENDLDDFAVFAAAELGGLACEFGAEVAGEASNMHVGEHDNDVSSEHSWVDTSDIDADTSM